MKEMVALKAVSTEWLCLQEQSSKKAFKTKFDRMKEQRGFCKPLRLQRYLQTSLKSAVKSSKNRKQ